MLSWDTAECIGRMGKGNRTGDAHRDEEHITAIGADDTFKKELDEDCFAVADHIYVDSLALNENCGEYAGALAKNQYLQQKTKELGTIFKNNERLPEPAAITLVKLVGLGVQDLAACSVVLNKLAGCLKSYNHSTPDVMETTHPNLVLIHQFFEAYVSNDLDKFRLILDENIKWHIPGKHPLSGTKTGIDDVLAYFRQLEKCAFKAAPMVMGVNDNYVIDCHTNWSNLPGDENLHNMSCLLWKFENGRIVEVHNFPQDQHVVDAFFSRNYTKD